MKKWFQRVTWDLFSSKKKDIPEGLWISCPDCKETLYGPALKKEVNVCSKCGFHMKISPYDYLENLVDENTFQEIESEMKSVDPLKFKDTKKYKDRLRDAMAKTGMNEAVITGTCIIDGLPVVVGIMNFAFIGGSMGSVVGEKVKRAIEKAETMNVPLIIISTSGGARMMEGANSLMQMAKTSAYLARFSSKGGLFISVLMNPTMAGVMASFASLGDLIIAEPKALIGFAGPRVIQQTIGEELPEGFQRSEFLLEHGFIDSIVSRTEMRPLLTKLLHFFNKEKKDKIENIIDK